MSINETELDQLITEAIQISMFGDLDETPELESWGISFCSRTLGAAECENGGFFWFKSKADLFDYVSRLLVFANYQMLSPNPFKLAGKAADIIKHVANAKLTMDEGRDRLNRALRHNSEIQWWGQFTELVHGTRPFEQKMRLLCRSENEKDNSHTGPITLNELEEFLACVQDYCPPTS